jgi:TPR repeat protein
MINSAVVGSLLLRLICVCLLGSAGAGAWAQDSVRSDWLRNPAMGNYKAYAEFKMAHYDFAREVWQTLAEVGNGDALFNLGILAEDGLGEPRNMAKAEALYASAAAAENFKAQYRLGLLYFSGTQLPQDREKARLYLTQAATHGDKDAQDMLARLGQAREAMTPFQQAELLSGGGQHVQAADIYRRLAEAGDARAQARLAWAYEAGRGVEPDLQEAARRFELAAEAGNAEAQYALAVMLRTGRGRAVDLQRSSQWLDSAAAQGHPAAQAAQASGRASTLQ